jgi:hypothetical protein
MAFYGDPAGTRTQDPYIKSVMLYQLSYGIQSIVLQRFENDKNRSRFERAKIVENGLCANYFSDNADMWRNSLFSRFYSAPAQSCLLPGGSRLHQKISAGEGC